jgi:uncharacterized membrane protein
MKNITLAMVAVLAAVTMLSAVLTVAPMQQAIASNGGSDGGNSIKVKQSNECEDTQPNSCQNEAEVFADQSIEED